MTRVPDGWTATTLGEVARWGSGGTPKAGDGRYYGGDLPWAVIGDLNDGVVRSTAQTITPLGLAESSAKLVPEGAVLVAMYGSIGKLGIAGRELATNQAIAFAVPDVAVLDRDYLFHFLLAQRHDLGRAGKGATQQNIGQGVLKAWPICFPGLTEQRRIVDLLEDHLSRLDAADMALLAGARRTRAAERAALDVFTAAPTRLVPLSDLVERVEAGKSFGSAARVAGEGEWAIIRVSAMTWGSFRPEENKVVGDLSRVDPRYEIKPGDVLVSRANTSEYVGASVLVSDTRARLLLSDKSLRVVPKAGVEPAFLHAVLRAPRTRAQISALATGTKDSMRNISQAALLKVMVPNLPADAQWQAVVKVESYSASLDRLRLELAEAKARSAVLRRSLLSAAFTGRLTPRGAEVLEMASV